MSEDIWDMKAKVGDIIYPAYNGTGSYLNQLLGKRRWDLVKTVDSKGYITDVTNIFDYSIVRTLDILKDEGIRK